jgi:hypothetical protein
VAAVYDRRDIIGRSALIERRYSYHAFAPNDFLSA